jgi:hypothetical protein
MRPKRPINQDVPTPKAEDKAPESVEENEPTSPEKAPRKPRPLAPKLLAALVALALVIIVVAIVGSSGGGDATTGQGAARPATTTASSDAAPASSTPETLGFPATATNNTTRVAGSDATANAAAAALAVFPSTTPAQRPAAVTLVDEEDWAGAIAASSLMAAPVRAPTLFSDPDELPEPTAEALEALNPQGDKATDGASYFTIGSVALPGGAGKTTRIVSGDPAATAARIATLREHLSGEAPEYIMVASIQYPEFAMPAAAWAARSGNPILFTDTNKLSAPAAAILKRNPHARVFCMGPAEIISLRTIAEIGKISDEVGRVLGPGPSDTALTFARNKWENFGWGINDPGHGFVLVNSSRPANAAAAAPLSASGTWGPLLLTKSPDRLPVTVREYLLDVKPGYTDNPTRAFYNHVWVIGDQDEISVKQQAEVNELAELTKIGGKR